MCFIRYVASTILPNHEAQPLPEMPKPVVLGDKVEILLLRPLMRLTYPYPYEALYSWVRKWYVMLCCQKTSRTIQNLQHSFFYNLIKVIKYRHFFIVPTDPTKTFPGENRDADVQANSSPDSAWTAWITTSPTTSPQFAPVIHLYIIQIHF